MKLLLPDKLKMALALFCANVQVLSTLLTPMDTYVAKFTSLLEDLKDQAVNIKSTPEKTAYELCFLTNLIASLSSKVVL